jgi:hypothetical protein
MEDYMMHTVLTEEQLVLEKYSRVNDGIKLV